MTKYIKQRPIHIKKCYCLHAELKFMNNTLALKRYKCNMVQTSRLYVGLQTELKQCIVPKVTKFSQDHIVCDSLYIVLQSKCINRRSNIRSIKSIQMTIMDEQHNTTKNKRFKINKLQWIHIPNNTITMDSK